MTDTRCPHARRPAVLVAALSGLLLLTFLGLGAPPLLDPDEGRYARIPQEMLARGDLLTPTLDGVLYFEKPPLVYWLTAGSLALFGDRLEVAVRLVPSLFALLAVGMAYLLGRDLGGQRVGLLAAAFLATAPLHAFFGHLATLDMPLASLVGASLTALWLAHPEAPARRRRWLWWAAACAAGLAVLTKGLIGALIPAATVASSVAISRRPDRLRAVPWWSAGAVAVAVAAPWHLAMALRHPGFFDFYVIHEHVRRFLEPLSGHAKPVWYYLPILLGGTLPWCGFLAASATREAAATARAREGRRFLLSWSGFVVVFFSLARSKVVSYVLPALLPLAVLAALGCEAALRSPGRSRTLARGGAVAGALGIAGLGALALAAGLGRLPEDVLPGPGITLVGGLGAVALVVALAGGGAWLAGRRVAAIALLTVAAATTSGSLWAAAARLGPSSARSARSFATALGSFVPPGEALYGWDCYRQSILAYWGGELRVVGWTGELAWGIGQLPSSERALRFPDKDAFRRLWRSPQRLYAVAYSDALPRMRLEGVTPGPILLEADGLVLTTNQPLLERATGGAPP